MASTESEALALDRRRAELEHALAVLVGEAASSFGAAPRRLDHRACRAIPAGVPATVLTRRPDVSAAQSSVLAAQARVGVAQAAWFPSIVADRRRAAIASPELGDLFKWSARAWGIGALLSLPIFDGGRREAGVQSAQRRSSTARSPATASRCWWPSRTWRTSSSALRLLDEQSEAQAQGGRRRRAAPRTLSDSRYRNGFVSQLDLLDARRSELRNRRQALQVRSAQYQATVGLIRALGGGWDVPRPRPMPRPRPVRAQVAAR